MIGFVVSFLAAAGVAHAAVLVDPALKPVNANMPQWNFANESTPDAKADGSIGVLLVGFAVLINFIFNSCRNLILWRARAAKMERR